MSNTTPQQIKKARKEAGLTVSQCAEIVGVHRTTWFRWERGQCNIPLASWELFKIKVKS